MMAASRQTQALDRTDLVEVEADPRILDVRLGERLGMAQPLNIRKVIEKNREELEQYGSIHAARELIQAGKGARREVEQFYLNEAQALLICMFSRTARAAEARREIVQVYLDWRKGVTTPRGRPLGTKFDRQRQHLSVVEESLAALERIVPLAHQVSHLPVWSNGRRPGWWADLDVRAFLTRTHRQMTLAAARAALIELYGPDRAPSVSGIHRYWQQLDQIAGLPPEPRLVWNREGA